MKIRILQVFFGADGLPYKDQARTVHYPITGNGFQNANNTTQIRFYFSQLSGENTTWVAVSKLPNGKVGSKVLETFIDDELNEPYALLELDSYYTQYKGDVFISLQGYQGGVQVTYDEQTEIYEISGTPTIAATGSVKFTNNYAPSFVGSGQEQNITIQQLLGYLSSKADIGNTIYIVSDIEDEDLSGYEDGQIIYDLFSDLYYEVNSQVQGGHVLANENGLLGNKGALIRFFGLTNTITLQQIYNLIGANRYGALNIGGKEYLVIMSANNSIKAYDLLEKKLYDYIDAPEDTFASVLDEIPTAFVEHTQQANRVYGTNQYAQETTILYSVNVVNNGIVQRDATGQINVPTTPAYAYNAASKNYIDSNYGKKVQLTIDNDTFVLTVKLLNNNDVVISQANVDLPLESIVVSAQYYDTYTYEGVTYTKVLVIVLATTSEPIIIPIGDLVSGLVSETTFNNAVAQLQTNINKCVQQTNSASVVYGTNASGSQTTIIYGTGVFASRLVQRDSSGQINVPAPNSNSNATSKQYVDTFGRTLEFSIDNSTYVMTFKLKDNNGNVISTQTIDLPLETVVVDGYYDSENENLVLELKNGNEITIPISDLISGLVTETSLATTLANYYTKSQIDQMVAGFVFADVDDYLSDSSTNPVENRVITDALETKANVDGNYPTMTVGNADQLNSTVFVVDKVPYLYRTSGGDADIGNREFDKIIGGSLAVNQLVNPDTLRTDGSTNITVVKQNGELILNGTTTNRENVTLAYRDIDEISSHKYLVSFGNKLPTGARFVVLKSENGQYHYVGDYNNPLAYVICSATNTGKGFGLSVSFNTSVTLTNFKITYIVIDLTAMFGSTIADYICSLETANAGAGVAWFRKCFNKPYYPYNAGAIKNVKLVSHDMVGFNQFDGSKATFGKSLSTGNGGWFNNANAFTSDYIKVLPNTTYHLHIGGTFSNIYICRYDANKNWIASYPAYTTAETNISSDNAEYIRFSVQGYGASYNNDVCINLSWSGWRNGQYEPYQKNSYPLDTTIELRGIPKLDSDNHLYFDGDEYSSDGKVTRKYGIVDLGTLNWEAYTSSVGSKTLMRAAVTNLVNVTNYWDVRAVGICSKYLPTVYGSLDGNNPTSGTFAYWYDKLYIYDSAYTNAEAFKTAMSGVYLVYELATTTEETATPFQEPQIVDDFGTEEYVVSTQDGWQVPVGHDTKYPANLRDKLQRLPDMPSVSQNVTETYVVNYNGTTKKCTFVDIAGWLGTNGWIKLTDITGYDAEKTQSLKNVNGTLTWVTEE